MPSSVPRPGAGLVMVLVAVVVAGVPAVTADRAANAVQDIVARPGG